MAQFIVLIRPCRTDLFEHPTPEEQRLISAHDKYYHEALEDGFLVIAGRTTERPYFGIIVMEAEDLDEARDFALSDPAVESQVFQAEIAPFRIALHRIS